MALLFMGLSFSKALQTASQVLMKTQQIQEYVSCCCEMMMKVAHVTLTIQSVNQSIFAHLICQGQPITRAKLKQIADNILKCI